LEPPVIRRSHGSLSGDRRLKAQSIALAIAAGVVGLTLLTLSYNQVPAYLFAAAALSGVWVGIASLFSP